MKNVLLITADHMRYDVLGCSGNEFVQTPNLDRLASTGVNFLNAFTTNPICVPARASITTGNYPHKAIGRKINDGFIRDDQVKIAEHFRNAGYRTYGIGKLHYVPYSPPNSPRLLHGFESAVLTEEGRILNQYDPYGELTGIEDYHDYLVEVGWGGYDRAHGVGNNDIHPAPSPLPKEHYVDAWVVDQTIKALERHITEYPETPFFLWNSFTKPHSPYDPPRPYDTLYDPRDVPKPYGDPGMLEGRNPNLIRSRGRHGWERFSPAMVQLARAYYFGQVTFQDHMIGRLLDWLESKDLLRDTVILYTSDHGDLLGDFGCFFKTNHLNGSVRIPFIVSGPGLEQVGVKSKALVGLQDVLPTLSSLAGIPLETEIDGIDLTKVLSGQEEGREIYVSQCLESPWQTYMVCDGDWKYIYTEANGVEELYYLVDDPYELVNLAGDASKKQQIKHYRDILVEWCQVNEDHEMLDEGGNLKQTPVDLKAEAKFDVGALGWRWF